MSHFGLLLTMTEPRPDQEAEFNAWYDSEHIVERLSIPGFLSARRWVADVKPGEGKYLATYELVSPDVLWSEAYRARYANPTPWTQRSLGNRFGVIVVVLLPLDERSDIDSRDDPRLKTQAAQCTAHKVGTQTRLHPNHTLWQSLEGFAQG